MAIATETSPGLPAAAEAANINTLTNALADAHISDEKPQGEDGESLEDGEIREDEDEDDEVDDGQPKTVFQSAKKFNLKVCAPLRSKQAVRYLLIECSTPCSLVGRYTLIPRKAKCYQRHLAQHLLHPRLLMVSPLDRISWRISPSNPV